MNVPAESEVKGQVVAAAAGFSLNMQTDDLHRGHQISPSPLTLHHAALFSYFKFLIIHRR